ncbi:unnamed protein product [Linum tenue]|uniref:Uncharacterized protein n=1 Tax=Linum tenue TaxID=586396 RepID=A0AAV0NMD5_9ROSI|nr:unnamed protein product [Linum tenue]
MRHSTSGVSALGCHFHFAYFYRRFAFCFTVPFGFRQVLLLPEHLFAVIVMCTNSMKMVIVDSTRRRDDSSPSIATLVASAWAVTPPPHQSPPRKFPPARSSELSIAFARRQLTEILAPAECHLNELAALPLPLSGRPPSEPSSSKPPPPGSTFPFSPEKRRRDSHTPENEGFLRGAVKDSGLVHQVTRFEFELLLEAPEQLEQWRKQCFMAMATLSKGFNNNKKRVRNGARCAAIAKEGNHFKGFSAEEIKLIAFLARHYRKKFP